MLINFGDLSSIRLINPDVMPKILGALLVLTEINVIHSKSLEYKMNLIYQKHPLFKYRCN